ncbi:MAG TPA: hypothetical protein VNZ52_16150 [Candidatus Thermoplasmatota archaeon]|nr:hypothetical protein [Candidatus Thermoplasmatota archaeon]
MAEGSVATRKRLAVTMLVAALTLLPLGIPTAPAQVPPVGIEELTSTLPGLRAALAGIDDLLANPNLPAEARGPLQEARGLLAQALGLIENAAATGNPAGLAEAERLLREAAERLRAAAPFLRGLTAQGATLVGPVEEQPASAAVLGYAALLEQAADVLAEVATFSPAETVVSTPRDGCPLVKAVPQNGPRVEVTWDNEPGATGYRVLRNGAVLAEVDQDTQRYIDRDVTAGETYRYQVVPVKEGGPTTCSEVEVTAIPFFPTALAAGLGLLATLGAVRVMRRARREG